MKNKIILTVIFLTVFAFVLNSAVFAKSMAVIIKVKGTVSLYKDNKVSQQKIRRGTRLEDGDKIVVDKNGYAAIRFIDDKSLLRVRANSTCIIRTRKDKNETIKNVFLEVGTIYARITKQNAKFEVQTPTSVASVKGTEWITKQIYGGMTYYFGKSGVFEVANNGGSVLCNEGETVEVRDIDTAPTTRKTIAGEDDWGTDAGQEDYEFEFENEQGEKRLLRFRIKIAEE